MIRKLLIIFMSLMLASCTNAPSDAVISSDPIDQEPVRYATRLSRSLKYDNGELSSEIIFSYDDKGLLSEEKETLNSSLTSYEYDERDLLIRKTVTQGSSTRVVEYGYSEDLLPLKESVYQDGTLLGTIERSYDEFGSLTRLTDTVNGTDILYEYERDGKGRIIRKITDRNGSIETQDYGYASDGKILKIETIDDSGNVTVEENAYENDLLINRKIYENSSLSIIRTYEYDERGNQIKDITHHVAENRDTVATYEYDENNDLIRQVNDNGIERRYEYERYALN